MNSISKKFGGLAVVVSAALATSANAAVDTTAALAGVTDAQSAVLTVVGGLIGMAAALFGAYKIYQLIKAGR